jgi:hypothetical protein
MSSISETVSPVHSLRYIANIYVNINLQPPELGVLSSI